MARYINNTFDGISNGVFTKQTAFPYKRFQCNLDDRASVLSINNWQGNRFNDGFENWNSNNLNDGFFESCNTEECNECNECEECPEDKCCFKSEGEGETRGCDAKRKFAWNEDYKNKDYVHWTEDKDLWPSGYLPWGNKEEEEKIE